jgi:hypothetical protein
LDELAEALIGEGPVLLHRPAVQDADVARLGQARELVAQARIADPRLARHHHELASPATAAFSRCWSSANSFVRPTKGAKTGRAATNVRVKPVTERARSVSRRRVPPGGRRSVAAGTSVLRVCP